MNSEITSAGSDARETITEETDAAGTVYEALAANPGATTTAIAAAAGIGKKGARSELLALEKAGAAARVKGGKPGVPDTWTLTATPDESDAPAAQPQGADDPVSGDEPRQGTDDTTAALDGIEKVREPPPTPGASSRPPRRASAARPAALAPGPGPGAGGAPRDLVQAHPYDNPTPSSPRVRSARP